MHVADMGVRAGSVPSPKDLQVFSKILSASGSYGRLGRDEMEGGTRHVHPNRRDSVAPTSGWNESERIWRRGFVDQQTAPRRDARIRALRVGRAK